MKYYSYYPGCSLRASSVAYEASARAVSSALEVELIELEDWNCCGATAYFAIDGLLAFCLAGRNLALAEQRGLDIVAPCSGCYTTLNKTTAYLKEYPEVKSKVNEALAAADLHYEGGVKVRHLVDVLLNDVGLETIQSKLSQRLEGLKVAPYYGCQLVRPALGFDDPEVPRSLDQLVGALGAEAVYFPLKSDCCSGSLIATRENLGLDLVYKLLRCAEENGAHCIVTVCPLCQTNLDAYQSRVNSKFKANFDLPILFITQLIGVGLGIDEKALSLRKNIVSPMKVLAPYL